MCVCVDYEHAANAAQWVSYCCCLVVEHQHVLKQKFLTTYIYFFLCYLFALIQAHDDVLLYMPHTFGPCQHFVSS